MGNISGTFLAEENSLKKMKNKLIEFFTLFYSILISLALLILSLIDII